MSSLPLYIVEIILLRLPVKFLIRCKSVCKAWQSLISDPYFIKTHLKLPETQARSRFCIIDEIRRHGINTNNSTAIVRGAFTKDCDAFSSDDVVTAGESMDLDYISDYKNFNFAYCIRLFSSCDGLLCIVDASGKIVIWNPSTRQHHQLPPNPNPHLLEFLTCCGFGYDSSSDDYKVIVVYTFRYINEETLVDVFSLKSNKWKNIEEIHHTTVGTRDSTVLRGALHWLNSSTSYDGIRKLKLYKITAFDFEKEEFREMSIPNNDRRFDLTVVGGCLCLYKGYVEMWVMKEYGIDTSWTKIISPFYNILRSGINILECNLLQTLNDKHLLLVSHRRLMLCDHRENTYKNIMCYDGDRLGNNATIYNETLVSPHPPTP